MSAKLADMGALIVCVDSLRKFANRQTIANVGCRRWLISWANRQPIEQTIKPAWILAKTPIYIVCLLFATYTHTQSFFRVFKQNFRVCVWVEQTDKQTQNHPHVGRFNHHHSTPKRGRLQMLRPTFF